MNNDSNQTSTTQEKPGSHKAKTKKKSPAEEKLYYKLEEISHLTKLETKTIESWEKELYFLHAGETASGKKIFRKKDLDIILRLKDLIENKGLTLAGAKRRIEEEFGLKTTTVINPDRLKKVLFEIRDQLKDISNALQNNQGKKKNT